MERHRWIERIISEKSIEGAIVRLVQNEYDPLTLISQRLPAMMIRWRIRPVTTKLRIWYNDVAPRSAGQLAIVPANTVIRALAPSKREVSRAVYLLLPDDWLFEKAGDAAKSLAAGRVIFSDYRSINIENAMRRIFREMSNPAEDSNSVIRAQMIAIVVDLFRRIDQEFLPNTDEKKIDDSVIIVNKLEQIILAIDKDIPLAEGLVEMMGIDLRTLDKFVRNVRGKTLNSLFADARILRAQRLLADQEFSLKEIAFKLGFCSPSAFSSAFRGATGETPRDYRASCLI